MSVAFDAAATGSTNSHSTSLTNGNLTVGTGANRVLIVEVAFGAAVTGVSAYWGTAGTNQAMTLIKSASTSSGRMVQLWGLVAPTSGHKTLGVTWTTFTDCILDCCSFTGATQVGGTTTFANSGSVTGSSGNASLTITSSAGDYAVDALTRVCGSGGGATSTPSQTLVYALSTGSYEGAASDGAAAGSSVVFGWTCGVNTGWAQVGCDIAQVVTSVTIALTGNTATGSRSEE